MVCQAEWTWLLLLGTCGAWSSRSVESKEAGSQRRRRSQAQAQELVFEKEGGGLWFTVMGSWTKEGWGTI